MDRSVPADMDVGEFEVVRDVILNQAEVRNGRLILR